MTQEEYKSIDWNRGNVVRLSNGNEYSVRGKNKRYIILYSEEYQKHFVADYRIIDCRVSDNIEPFVQREHPTAKHQAAAAAAPKPEVKAEPAPAAKAEPAPTPAAAEQPAPEKKKRRRITVSRSERVQY